MADDSQHGSEELPDQSEAEDEGDERKFQFGLDASETYSLFSIVNYVRMSTNDPEAQMAAEMFSRRLLDLMGSEEFNDELEQEVEKAVQQMATPNTQTDFGAGVQ